MVIFFKMGLYFFNSILSGLFFLFLVEIYLDVPGIPLVLCSVHSRMICPLASLFFLAMLLLLSKNLDGKSKHSFAIILLFHKYFAGFFYHIQVGYQS